MTLGGEGLSGAAITFTLLGRGFGRAIPAPVVTSAPFSRTHEVRIVMLGSDRPMVHAHDRDEDDGHQDEIEYECG